MPAYQWKCHVCQSVNEAGSDACTQCGFAANASGRQIEQAKRRAAGIADDQGAPYRTFWRRFFAMCIDALIVFIPLGVLNWYVLDALTGSFLLAFWMMFSTAIAFAYSIILHGKYGQTIGKRIMLVKIFDVSGNKISIRQAIRREIVLVGLSMAMVIVNMPLYLSGHYVYGVGEPPPQLYTSLNLALHVWVWLEFLSMLFSDKRRSVNDFIAGTVVMRVDPESVSTVSANAIKV